MAIKYIIIPEKRTVYGIINDTKYDALNRIDKMMHSTGLCLSMDHWEKFMMPGSFRARVVCDPRDEFNAEKGCELAKKKVLKNYYKSMDKRVDAFKSMLIDINSKVFETPSEIMK